jgi:hypothetical protein
MARSTKKSGRRRLKDFYQIQPGDNIAPSKPTEVLIG